MSEHSYTSLQKFNAYKRTAENYDEAMSIVESKKLVFGEPAVVPFKEDGTTKLIVAIGGLDGTNKYTVMGEQKDTRKNSYTSIRKVRDYLYEVEYDSIDYAFAKKYFAKDNIKYGSFGCSSMRSGDMFGRNYDWYYGNTATFVVRTAGSGGRHEVLGVASGTSALTEERTDKMDYCEAYDIMPFFLLDGRNDAGVFCNINVVHKDKPYKTVVIDENDDTQLCALMVPRYVLDNCSSADEAVSVLSSLEIYVPKAFLENDTVFHYMIGDSSKTYVVELIGDGIVCNESEVMTNFYIDGVEFNEDGTVPTNADVPGKLPSEQGITSYAGGTERFNVLVNAHDTASSHDGMRNAMSSILYTNTYKQSTSPFWFSEYAGLYNGVDITNDTPTDDEAMTDRIETLREWYNERELHRDKPSTWFTAHSSVYDIQSGKLYVVAQEDTEHEFEFSFKKYYTVPEIDKLTLWENGEGEGSVQTKGTQCRAKGDYSVASGIASSVLGASESAVIAEWNDGAYAGASGHLVTVSGRASHGEGNNTITNNPSEHAEGQYNVSHFSTPVYGNAGNTQHSIGIGTNNDTPTEKNRKNAFEVMQNGDIYILGIGGYDGTNAAADGVKTLQQILSEN